jgi:hypothetical protein
MIFDKTQLKPRRNRCEQKHSFHHCEARSDALSWITAERKVCKNAAASGKLLWPTGLDRTSSDLERTLGRTWGLTMSLATSSCVQKLQAASHITS